MKITTMTFAAIDTYREEFSYYAAELTDINDFQQCARELAKNDIPSDDFELINWEFIHGYFCALVRER